MMKTHTKAELQKNMNRILKISKKKERKDWKENVINCGTTMKLMTPMTMMVMKKTRRKRRNKKTKGLMIGKLMMINLEDHNAAGAHAACFEESHREDEQT